MTLSTCLVASLSLPDEAAASAEQSQDTGDSERGEKTAENIRYGQNISESGMGGKTTESKGVAQQGERISCTTDSR